MELAKQEQSELRNFIEFLFAGLSGTAYIASKNPEDSTDWVELFHEYPADISRMEKVILSASAQNRDVYLAPVLYKSHDYSRENFKCSNVVWTEFDGNAPSEDELFAKPSYRIQSSTEDNQHVYWRLNEPLFDANALEAINKDITYYHSADSSAWDATQVLRPPGTINRKPERNGETVKVVGRHSLSYDVSYFGGLPKAPESIDVSNWQLGTLPDINHVLLIHSWSPDMALLFAKDKSSVKDRSASLMNLAYGLAQMGLSDAEIFVCLKNADDRWEKFSGRKDRNKRLAHIITIARNKYPDTTEESEAYAFALDFTTFLNTDIEIDWVIEPMLMEQGSMLMVGPSGIGKTTITLQFMIHMALGKDFLGYTINKPRKLIFLSLEMGFGELKVFVKAMAKHLSAEELLVLQENLILVPHGEKWPLNTPVGQEHLLRMIEEYAPDGIFLDSIGSAINGSISADEIIQPYIDFIDGVRKKYGCFWWHIHHMRKPSNSGNTTVTQDDIYGNQYLLNRATSSYGLLWARGGMIKIRNFKQRLATKEDDFKIKRVDGHTFERVMQDVDDAITHMVHKPDPASKGPVEIGNFNV